MKLYPEYCCKDRHFAEGDDYPECAGMNILNHDSHVYGHVMLPGGDPKEKHAAVLVLHGFPGHTTNIDLDLALARIGCVVFNPLYRGAWGSEGYYTFDGLVDDAIATANWIRSEETVKKYHLDPDNLFLIGHSMGGFAGINTLRRVHCFRGAVIMAPYDMPWFFENNRVQDFKNLLLDGDCLHVETPTSMFENAQACYKDLAFSAAADDLKDTNIYFIGAKKDFTAPPADMIEPLYHKLKAQKTSAIRLFDLVDAPHSFDDMRFKLFEMITNWMVSMAK
ncbi:MAG: alpha/beta hydrolase [Oscillibacter sp.]|jgi:acetyl esterase/lipase|nr:alpha/beta hydrolase [Oscillibacter sp.]